MSKGIEIPNFWELLEDLQSINEIKERVNTIDLIRLKELILFIDLRINSSIKTIIERRDMFPHETFEYAAASSSQFYLTYYDLKSLKNLIQTRVNFLSEKQTNAFNDLIFKDSPSERFFVYLVENWLKDEVNKVTALRFVFSEMWYQNPEKETPYKIKCTQTYFAREYWNKKHSSILKLNHKNSKLNNDSFKDYYHKRFKQLLNEFQGG